MSEHIASLPDKLEFKDFYSPGDGLYFDIDSVTVTVDDQLRRSIQDAVQFMQHHPRLVQCVILLHASQYKVQPKPYEGRKPTMAFLLVDDAGRLTLRIDDRYGSAESSYNPEGQP